MKHKPVTTCVCVLGQVLVVQVVGDGTEVTAHCICVHVEEGAGGDYVMRMSLAAHWKHSRRQESTQGHKKSHVTSFHHTRNVFAGIGENRTSTNSREWGCLGEKVCVVDSVWWGALLLRSQMNFKGQVETAGHRVALFAKASEEVAGRGYESDERSDCLQEQIISGKFPLWLHRTCKNWTLAWHGARWGLGSKCPFRHKIFQQQQYK